MRGLKPHKEPPPTRAPKIPPMERPRGFEDFRGRAVWVVDAWDADENESYVAVFFSRKDAVADLSTYRFERSLQGHEIYSGIVKRVVS